MAKPLRRRITLFKEPSCCLRCPCLSKKYGTPKSPEDLAQHRCLVMERLDEQLNQWHFKPLPTATTSTTIKVNATLIGSDGALIRQWTLAGVGLALKSLWDVQQDIAAGRLTTVLNDYISGAYTGDDQTVGMQLVYSCRKYLPRQVAGFIDYFVSYMAD